MSVSVSRLLSCLVLSVDLLDNAGTLSCRGNVSDDIRTTEQAEPCRRMTVAIGLMSSTSSGYLESVEGGGREERTDTEVDETLCRAGKPVEATCPRLTRLVAD